MNFIETSNTEHVSSVFSARDRIMLKEMLETLRRTVHILVLTNKEADGPGCSDLARELQQISQGQLVVDVLSIDAMGAVPAALGVHHTPSWRFLATSGEVAPVEFVGLPTGYQFGAFLNLVVDLSQNRVHFNHRMHNALKAVPTDVLIEVIVSATCPNCPEVVRLAYECALTNPARIFARVIDGAQFPSLVPKEVELVPYTRISTPNHSIQERIGMMSGREILSYIHASAKGAISS